MKNKLHGGLSLSEYWEYSKQTIADIRKWGTVARSSSGQNQRSKEENRNKYMKQCDHHIAILAQYLPNKSMSDLSAFELLKAVETSQYAKKKPYSVSTLKSRLSILRDIYDYAEDCGHACNELRYIGEKCINSIFKVASLPDKKQREHLRKLARESGTKARSLTCEQQEKLVETILNHIEEDGRYLMLAVLLYTGMRPSECRGLNWYDLIPFRSHPERHMLPLDRQRDDANGLIDRLKRPASYRKVGVHIKLEEIISRRRKFVRGHYASDEDIASLPLCCFENKFERGCTRSQLSIFAAKMLKEVIHVSEEVMDYCMLDMLAYESDTNTNDSEDIIVTTYLLRHDFWTWMQASTELSAEEKRYFFGHAIYDGKVDRRPVYNNEDVLWDMLLKLDHTIKFLPLHEVRMNGSLKPEAGLSATNKGVYTLQLTPELLREGGHVTIVLQANEYDDPIAMKTLSPTRNVFQQEPLKLKATVLPHIREESSRKKLNTDYDNWKERI